jgi:hypothetical protein
MIVFDLACTQGHRFEGWFASADDFASQAKGAMVRCPVCDDAGVVRLPSAKVRIGRGGPRTETSPSPPSAASAPAISAGTEAVAGIPAEVLAKLRDVIRNTENVGRRFPEEARKIHYEEAPARPIRGQASKEESEALAEEGIEFSPLPDFLTREVH